MRDGTMRMNSSLSPAGQGSTLTDPGVLAEVLHHCDVRKADGQTAGDLMTRRVVTVRPEDSVEQAAQLMHFLKVKRLPVVDADGSLVGLISGPTCSSSTTARTRTSARRSRAM
jgi:CBS-domain-containing membrane protein